MKHLTAYEIALAVYDMTVAAITTTSWPEVKHHWIHANSTHTNPDAVAVRYFTTEGRDGRDTNIEIVLGIHGILTVQCGYIKTAIEVQPEGHRDVNKYKANLLQQMRNLIVNAGNAAALVA